MKAALRATLAALIALAIALPFRSLRGQAPGPSLPPSAPMPRKISVVVIDPAHGGTDNGARGTTGTIESDAVFDFGRAMRVALESRGFTVKITREELAREGNPNPTFDDRAALANRFPDAIFVTLHVASTGTPGTVRAYYCETLPPLPPAAQAPKPQRGAPAPAARQPTPLLDWDRAQEPYVPLSQRLAELVQIQLAERFQGSPEIPSAAAVRQLRTIAAPAIAIEVSSIALDAAQLGRMGQPIGEALASAATTLQQVLPSDATVPGGGR